MSVCMCQDFFMFVRIKSFRQRGFLSLSLFLTGIYIFAQFISSEKRRESIQSEERKSCWLNKTPSSCFLNEDCHTFSTESNFIKALLNTLLHVTTNLFFILVFDSRLSCNIDQEFYIRARGESA